jgi:hypothetical protein
MVCILPDASTEIRWIFPLSVTPALFQLTHNPMEPTLIMNTTTATDEERSAPLRGLVAPRTDHMKAIFLQIIQHVNPPQFLQ